MRCDVTLLTLSYPFLVKQNRTWFFGNKPRDAVGELNVLVEYDAAAVPGPGVVGWRVSGLPNLTFVT